MRLRELIGELLGTFSLVFIGCSSVAYAVLFETLGLFSVSIIWGFGVAISIYAFKSLSPAHFNPAVSFAFFLRKEINWKRLVGYSLAQLIGALAGATLVYSVFMHEIAHYELVNNIARGSIQSQRTAAIFGEFYYVIESKELLTVNWLTGMFMEALGTFLLMCCILFLSINKVVPRTLAPIVVGLSVSIIICIVAPYTQAGLNPARDFGPRILAYFAGWGNSAFPVFPGSFFTVYILGPLLGSSLAVFLTTLFKAKN